jgi:hypothetical protein
MQAVIDLRLSRTMIPHGAPKMLVVSQILYQHIFYACFICIVTVGLGRAANLFSHWAQKYVQPALSKHLRTDLQSVREGLNNYEALHCLCVCFPVCSHLSKYLYFPQCSLKFVMKMEPKPVSILSIQYFLSANTCKNEYEKLVG